MTEQTYLYNNIEYKMTGRVAIPNSQQDQTRRQIPDDSDQSLYEITPIDSDSIVQPIWVRRDDLYKIETIPTDKLNIQ